MVKTASSEKKKFSWKEVINTETRKKFKAMKSWYNFYEKGEERNRYIADELETGFCINKDGRIHPNEYEKDMIMGTEGKIKLSSQCWREFQDNGKYSVHSHPGFYSKRQKSLSEHFSLDDFITASTYNEIPCLVFRRWELEESKKTGKKRPTETYFIKCHPNLPHDRMQIIEEYGHIKQYYDDNIDKINREIKGGDILAMDRKEYREWDDKIQEVRHETREKLRDYEKKNQIEKRKLFKYVWKEPKR